MKWREFFRALAEETDYDYDFATPATYFQLERMEQIFGLKLSGELRRLLLETNGVQQILVYQEARIPVGKIIWDAETIQQSNRKMRSDPAYRDFYLPFESLLFFGSPGKGNLRFALCIQNDVVTGTVVLWNPADDSRTHKADSLQTFLTD